MEKSNIYFLKDILETKALDLCGYMVGSMSTFICVCVCGVGVGGGVCVGGRLSSPTIVDFESTLV